MPGHAGPVPPNLMHATIDRLQAATALPTRDGSVEVSGLGRDWTAHRNGRGRLGVGSRLVQLHLYINKAPQDEKEEEDYATH